MMSLAPSALESQSESTTEIGTRTQDIMMDVTASAIHTSDVHTIGACREVVGMTGATIEGFIATACIHVGKATGHPFLKELHVRNQEWLALILT